MEAISVRQIQLTCLSEKGIQPKINILRWGMITPNFTDFKNYINFEIYWSCTVFEQDAPKDSILIYNKTNRNLSSKLAFKINRFSLIFGLVLLLVLKRSKAPKHIRWKYLYVHATFSEKFQGSFDINELEF